MSDDTPVPETLETIAASIRELRTSINSRFGAVDKRFDAVDKRFDEMKAQLRTEIESVRGDVRLVAEGLAAQTQILRRQEQANETKAGRLADHDVRILAIERGKTGGSGSAG